MFTRPRRASSTRQPKVRMMMEVSSGAMTKNTMSAFHRPAKRTMKNATG